MPGTVVVTGTSTGIGRATALRLHQAGFRVLAGVRRLGDADPLIAEAAGIEPVLLDVTSPETVSALVAQVGESPLAGLVNNAGIAVGGPLEYVAPEDLRRQFEVNVFGLVAVTQALLPALRRGTGRIVNIGSVGGRVATPFVGPYNASKYAVEALTDALRQELSPWGIHVVVVEPGAVSTPIWDKGAAQVDTLNAALPAEARERYGRVVARFRDVMAEMDKRGVAPDAVAAAVEKALTATPPRTRYLVGVDARVQVALKAVTTDRGLDRALRKLLKL